MYLITGIEVHVPADPGAIAVPLELSASSPDGEPIPVNVSAFVAGATGP
jgi:hypothetical protein